MIMYLDGYSNVSNSTANLTCCLTAMIDQMSQDCFVFALYKPYPFCLFFQHVENKTINCLLHF